MHQKQKLQIRNKNMLFVVISASLQAWRRLNERKAHLVVTQETISDIRSFGPNELVS